MGGAALLHAAVSCGVPLFSGMLLVDPIVLPPERYRISTSPHPLSILATKRKKDFVSPEAMFDRFKDRYPFKHWSQRALLDYCQYGLQPKQTTDGSIDGYTLSCPPALEAAAFAGSTNPEADLHGKLGTLKSFVHILRAGTGNIKVDAEKGMWHVSPTDPSLAKEFNSLYVSDFQTGLSHFMPFEEPEYVAKHIATICDSVSQPQQRL